jgi:hypothetical protein
MDALMALAVATALIALVVLLWTVRRRRSDQRLQWQGMRTRDWSIDELDELAAPTVSDVFTEALAS